MVWEPWQPVHATLENLQKDGHVHVDSENVWL